MERRWLAIDPEGLQVLVRCFTTMAFGPVPSARFFSPGRLFLAGFAACDPAPGRLNIT